MQELHEMPRHHLVDRREQQAILAREVNKGLPVEIRVQDYRDVNVEFDRVVSIAMLEAVGYRNFRHPLQALQVWPTHPMSTRRMHILLRRRNPMQDPSRQG
ncbi:MAG: hypothetical protein EOP49_06310 [Sphingobacteriales bacterium]|nr:MAG: hypothetical protein EOP49_06310 [Sphingobacteriales bacterium]